MLALLKSDVTTLLKVDGLVLTMARTGSRPLGSSQKDFRADAGTSSPCSVTTRSPPSACFPSPVSSTSR